MMLAKLALKIKARGLSSVLAWSCLGVSTFSGEAVSNVARCKMSGQVKREGEKKKVALFPDMVDEPYLPLKPLPQP